MSLTRRVTVEADDLRKIGGTTSPSGHAGGTSFICDSRTANIEEILLRNILAMSGHKIVSISDFCWVIEGDPDEHVDIEFVTDYPWEAYAKRFSADTVEDTAAIDAEKTHRDAIILAALRSLQCRLGHCEGNTDAALNELLEEAGLSVDALTEEMIDDVCYHVNCE
jgi:hypothetical protein